MHPRAAMGGNEHISPTPWKMVFGEAGTWGCSFIDANGNTVPREVAKECTERWSKTHGPLVHIVQKFRPKHEDIDAINALLCRAAEPEPEVDHVAVLCDIMNMTNPEGTNVMFPCDGPERAAFRAAFKALDAKSVDQ